ncbi:MAG: serine hydrolase [Deltaproteobacteria bacterium]|nr:MAG: serine hydrolase [Deltaproteobacteria bacterium]TMQ24491.1 MAG: serine hydrolase [Deltaproteobacteria bacterium]
MALAACGDLTQPEEPGQPEELGQREQAALAETLNTTPTAWWWYYGISPAQLSSIVSSTGGRIVSLQVEQASPLLFTVALVSNTGSYAKSWWYYYGLTASQLSANINSLNARIVSLDAYDVGGTTYFAAVLISNTGADAKGWWWYYGVTTSQIATLLSQNNARLVDFRSYVTGGVTRYAVVMIPNTGGDAMAWWWYYGVTGSQVGSLLSQNNAFLISIEPADAGGSTFNVVMEQNPGIYWWWYYGLSAADLGDRLSQNGARLLDVKSYFINGSRRFAAVMVNNSNAASTRVGQILRSGTDGETGLYLKQVGGGVQASLQDSRIFEPASSIKILIGLHAMEQVDAGASLGQSVVVYAPPASGSCPTSTITGTEPMGNAILQMLESSDNQRTRAMIDTYGFAAINQTAQNIGLTGTHLNHYPGCGGPPANQMTLADAGVIYEGIANGTLLSSTNRPELYSRMPAQAGDFTGIQSAVNAIVDAEAPAFGLNATEISQFKSRLLTHYKAGGYTLCPSSPCLEYRSVAGSAEIPQCTRGLVGSRSFVWGIFIDGSTSATAANNTFNAAKAEPLREPIRSALSTWAPCF